MKIEDPLFRKFSAKEFYSFSKRILPILDQLDAESLGLAKPLATAQKSFYVLQSHFNSNSVIPCNQSMVNADGNRSDAFVGFRNYLLACERRNNQELKYNARILLDAIKKYGWDLELESSVSKTNKLSELLKDIRVLPILSKALATLNMKEWFNELDEAQNRFMAVNRNNVEDRPQSGSCACTEIRNSLGLVFRYIELMQLIQPNHLYLSVIKDFNVVINEFNNEVQPQNAVLDDYKTSTL